MDGDRAVVGGGPCELPAEYFGLFLKRRTPHADEAGIFGVGGVQNPPVQTDLADRGMRRGVEAGGEFFSPVWRTVSDVPRMDAVAREDPVNCLVESGHGIPIVVGVSAIDDGSTEPNGVKDGDDGVEVVGQLVELQVIMGVVEHGPVRGGAGLFPGAGVFDDPTSDGGEAVLTSARQIAKQFKVFEDSGLGSDGVGGSYAIVAAGEEDNETSNHGGVAIGAKLTETIYERGDEQYPGRATRHDILGGAIGFGEDGQAAGGVDDRPEAFLAIFDKPEIVDDGLVVFANGHGDEVGLDCRWGEGRSKPQPKCEDDSASAPPDLPWNEGRHMLRERCLETHVSSSYAD